MTSGDGQAAGDNAAVAGEDAAAGAGAATAATAESAATGAAEAAEAAALRRWKIVALVSAFVAVVAVSMQVGWVLRGPQAVPPPGTFTGGGTVVAPQCTPDVGGITVDNAQVLVFDAKGKELASSRLMAGNYVVHGNGDSCLRSFVIAGIPSGGGIYTLQVGRWRQTVTEAALRANLAEMPIS